MPYILQGTRQLVQYWEILGRPCELRVLSAATGIPKINFMAGGRNPQAFTAQYGEVRAQNLAAVMGTTVANITASGGQFLR